ncbi:MAG TPA: FAD-binding oxidoreductase [Vicinamibacterales bacterium]|nr:FAD-binding oxidoreductase [Vicinamibacterales bacterium]
MQSFTATVTAIRDLTHDVRQIDLALLDPREIAFSAGQFISFEVDRPGFPMPATRPYSVASPPEHRSTIQLVLNLVPGGPGSGYLFSLREGVDTQFKGPVGSFTLRDSSRDVLFVVTGTGIAPIRSMLSSLAIRGSRRRLTLIWGLRSERDLYYQEELAVLQDRLPNFSFTTTLSQPTASWRGSIGRVTPLVAATVSDVSSLEVYLCGNGAMIRDVRDVIRRKGLCPIYTEQYYA